jgi:hypothetical protein
MSRRSRSNGSSRPPMPASNFTAYTRKSIVLLY